MVNDRMQRGYAYWHRAGRPNLAPGFTPDSTPKEMLRLGVFGVEVRRTPRRSFHAAGSPAPSCASSGMTRAKTASA